MNPENPLLARPLFGADPSMWGYSLDALRTVRRGKLPTGAASFERQGAFGERKACF